METTQIYTEMNRQRKHYILFSLRKEILPCETPTNLKGHHAKWNTPVREREILCDSTHTLEKRPNSHKQRSSRAQDYSLLCLWGSTACPLSSSPPVRPSLPIAPPRTSLFSPGPAHGCGQNLAPTFFPSKTQRPLAVWAILACGCNLNKFLLTP